jgi:protein-disulfide isomerase
LPQIEKEYIETGKLKYVYADFPLESIHPKALKAHEAANCAGDQGKYWDMHGLIFENRSAMEPDDFRKHAGSLGLDMTKFNTCLDSGMYTDEVRKDMAEGRKAGVRGTPTFFLGLTGDDENKVKVTKIIRGARSFPAFKEAIEGLLSTKTK